MSSAAFFYGIVWLYANDVFNSKKHLLDNLRKRKNGHSSARQSGHARNECQALWVYDRKVSKPCWLPVARFSSAAILLTL